ncbi:MAG: nickel/cobalt transporter (NicO) family protein [bacterium]|jgi:ABC-type nickel/cobalt efflux system permease component RcnA
MRSASRTPWAALLATLAAAVAFVAIGAATAGAHPLGNFSVNHIAFVAISHDRVDVRYVLDQAEIPTFQERDEPLSAVLAAKRAEVGRGLRLRVDGRPVTLVLDDGGRIALRPGQGGLHTTRVELRLHGGVRRPRRVELEDRTFAGRVGWRDIVVAPGDGTAVRSSVPASDPTRELRAYPRSLLTQPADRRRATFTVTAGSGTVQAPRADGAAVATTAASRDRFAGLFEDAAAGHGVLLLLVLAAFGWGALHALSPGHGKTMVAAYLVGARGTARDALLLGLTVTVTHTIGVFALGLVALSLSAYVLPEDLYPWLNLVAGLMVLAVGTGVLRARVRERRGRVAHGGHHHGHGHAHHHHGQHHGHGHDHHHHGHHHDNDHDHGHGAAPRQRLSARGLAALGASAGLIPCPSALVVLLGAVAQHEIALGMGLIVAFSAGLAATLSVLGLAVVWTSGLAVRLPRQGRLVAAGRALPLVSALAIVGIGALFTAQAVPTIV